MISDSKISALLQLLDDPDEFVFYRVSQELKTLGQGIVSILETTWETSSSPILQSRIEEIIQEIHFEETVKAILKWTNCKDKSVLDAALILSKYQYPEMDEQYIYEFIDQLTQDVWLELNSEYTAMEKVHIINKVFFDIYGFEINKKNYYSEKNNLIYNVIKSRSGSPLSLSIIYLEIAQRLKIPIYGVNLPTLFIMVYLRAPKNYIKEINNSDILFYLNTFNKGSFFQQEDIHRFLNEIHTDIKGEYFFPCDETTIVKRMINNLMYSFEQMGKYNKVKKLKILSKHIS